VAKTSLINKWAGEKKFAVRNYSRCKICGRPHGYMRRFGICRLCFRDLAHRGEIPGVRKASW
jgi:small subunit ribosomal protein S14